MPKNMAVGGLNLIAMNQTDDYTGRAAAQQLANAVRS
jgi:hypothetical protein